MNEKRRERMRQRRDGRERPSRDAEIPGLAAATDAETMRPRLASLLARPADSELSIQVRHAKPGRHCVVDYELTGGGETRRVIGKVFAKDKRAERLWRVLETLAAASEPGRSPAPAPLALVKESQLVLMEYLEGPTLLSLLLESKPEEGRRALSQAAAALAAFHAVPAEGGKLGTLDEELASLRKHIDEYGDEAPQVAARVAELLGKVETLAAGLEQPARPSLVHTGMRPDAVVLASDRAAFLDLDGWAEGDPALDLGCFCAEVWNEARQEGRDDLLPYRDEFLKDYAALTETPGIVDGALLYEAFTLIRLTLRRLRRLSRDSEEREIALPDEELLQRAEECLAQLEPRAS